MRFDHNTSKLNIQLRKLLEVTKHISLDFRVKYLYYCHGVTIVYECDVVRPNRTTWTKAPHAARE